jgi:hypothetical protein
MVGVPLQVEQEDIGDHRVAVPAMGGSDAFVAAAGQPLPPQPVVLHVVDGFEQADADNRLPDQPGQDDGAKPDGEHREEHDAEQPRIEHIVAKCPARFLTTGPSSGFQPPGGAHAAEDGPRDERVQALAQS